MAECHDCRPISPPPPPPPAVKYHPRWNFWLRNFPFSLSSHKKQLGNQAYRNTKAFSWGITAPLEGTPNFFFASDLNILKAFELFYSWSVSVLFVRSFNFIPWRFSNANKSEIYLKFFSTIEFTVPIRPVLPQQCKQIELKCREHMKNLWGVCFKKLRGISWKFR
jgi:hypothetical protein